MIPPEIQAMAAKPPDAPLVLILAAMALKRPMVAEYHGRTRVFCPVTVGASNHLELKVNAYQLGDEPGFRTFRGPDLVDLAVTADHAWPAEAEEVLADPKGFGLVLGRVRRGGHFELVAGIRAPKGIEDVVQAMAARLVRAHAAGRYITRPILRPEPVGPVGSTPDVPGTFSTILTLDPAVPDGRSARARVNRSVDPGPACQPSGPPEKAAPEA
jgi:hypothetical protein